MDEHVIEAIRDIVWMARRYADGRNSYAPGMFNDAYDVLRKAIDVTIETVESDTVLSSQGANFPYATDGNGRVYRSKK